MAKKNDFTDLDQRKRKVDEQFGHMNATSRQVTDPVSGRKLQKGRPVPTAYSTSRPKPRARPKSILPPGEARRPMSAAARGPVPRTGLFGRQTFPQKTRAGGSVERFTDNPFNRQMKRVGRVKNPGFGSQPLERGEPVPAARGKRTPAQDFLEFNDTLGEAVKLQRRRKR